MTISKELLKKLKSDVINIANSYDYTKSFLEFNTDDFKKIDIDIMKGDKVHMFVFVYFDNKINKVTMEIVRNSDAKTITYVYSQISEDETIYNLTLSTIKNTVEYVKEHMCK